MATHYRTKGFVLKKDDLGEADQVFIIYTEDFGKLKIVAKAIRKIKSKLRAGIELFYLSEIEFIQGKTHKTLTDAIAIDKFEHIREDLERLEVANQIAEISDELIQGEERDEQIWNLLSEVFKKLNPAISGSKLKIIYYYFLWNLLSILGYQINLYHCLDCQRDLVPGKLYFNPAYSGITCCGEGELISSDVVKILRLFLKKDWNILSKLKIEKKQLKELIEISEKHIESLA